MRAWVCWVAAVGGVFAGCSDEAPSVAPAVDGGPPATTSDAGPNDAKVTESSPPVVNVIAPVAGTSETRRLLRATIEDADGIAKVSYAINGGADVNLTASGKEATIKEALALDPGENKVVLTVTDTGGAISTTTIVFRYGLVTAAGGSHSGVIHEGALYTFGRNNVGQLGIGPAKDASKSTPTKITTTTTPAAIAFNQNNSLFVDTTGGVTVWGENTSGELGLGTTGVENRRDAPVANESLKDISYAALGYGHSIAIAKDGSIKSWGGNELGQVGVAGDGTKNDLQPSPVTVSGLPADVVKVVGGSQHSVALTASGDVFVWGRNEYGNLGVGKTDTDRHPEPGKVPGVDDIVDIASGRDHILAVKADGSVLAWGLGASGQLASGDPEEGGSFESPHASPAPVVSSADGATKLDGVATVYANGNTSFALKRDGTLWGWGEDGNGTLAQGGAGGPGAAAHKVGHAIRAGVFSVGSGTPEYFDQRAKVQSMAVGALHVVALTDKHELYTWGWSTNGTLGIADFPAIWRQPTPALVTLP